MNTTSFKSSETDQLRHSPENVLLLPSSDKTLCIPLDSIIRIEASSNYSKVFCKDQRFPIVVAKVLKWFEGRLPRKSFARVHRTHLINKLYVLSVKNNKVLIKSGTMISISRRKRKNYLLSLEKESI